MFYLLPNVLLLIPPGGSPGKMEHLSQARYLYLWQFKWRTLNTLMKPASSLRNHFRLHLGFFLYEHPLVGEYALSETQMDLLPYGLR